jgi:hypothetical protein
LSIGSLILSPAFNGATLNYTTTTSNATNTINATATDSGSTITIKNGDDVIANASAITWKTGLNTLKVTVANGGQTKVYTVSVTKE